MAVKDYTPKNILIEFFIVILGITIAFWLSNVGEDKKERKLEEVYLKDINADLTKDHSDLTYSIKMNSEKLKVLQAAIQYYQENSSRLALDTVVRFSGIVGSYYHFTPNDYTYLTLQQSGDFKIILDNELKKHLVEVYQTYKFIEAEQKNLLDALDQNYFPTLMSKYDMISGTVEDPDYFKSASFKNTLVFTTEETTRLIQLYEMALTKLTKFQETYLN